MKIKHIKIMSKLLKLGEKVAIVQNVVLLRFYNFIKKIIII